MSRRLAALVVALVVMGACDDESGSGVTQSIPAPPHLARMETSMGDIVIELYQDESPVTVANFVRYASEGFYDSLLFHRVIPDFMIQGGGFGAGLTPRPPTYDPIVNEASNGVSNRRGTIAMARTSDPHSATSQFFINVKDNPFLDFRSETPQGFGYAVFGEVVSGMDVVDEIVEVPTGSINGLNDTPLVPIFIHSVNVFPRWKAEETLP